MIRRPRPMRKHILSKGKPYQKGGKVVQKKKS